MSFGRSLEEFGSATSDDDVSPREIAFFSLLGLIVFVGLVILARWCFVRPLLPLKGPGYFAGRVRVAYTTFRG